MSEGWTVLSDGPSGPIKSISRPIQIVKRPQPLYQSTVGQSGEGDTAFIGGNSNK